MFTSDFVHFFCFFPILSHQPPRTSAHTSPSKPAATPSPTTSPMTSVVPRQRPRATTPVCPSQAGLYAVSGVVPLPPGQAASPRRTPGNTARHVDQTAPAPSVTSAAVVAFTSALPSGQNKTEEANGSVLRPDWPVTENGILPNCSWEILDSNSPSRAADNLLREVRTF
ncbi:unnamed protein product [Protopolystoma xenopodis]|uniref:Uncharacterized protein n=1 Tax=Protopolystoma xenopodis TaxID=117903 RepID=A0A448XLU7_9PLAT|nr:unnamed protein product [Protopolystoma xenopodis]